MILLKYIQQLKSYIKTYKMFTNLSLNVKLYIEKNV